MKNIGYLLCDILRNKENRTSISACVGEYHYCCRAAYHYTCLYFHHSLMNCIKHIDIDNLSIIWMGFEIFKERITNCFIRNPHTYVGIQSANHQISSKNIRMGGKFYLSDCAV